MSSSLVLGTQQYIVSSSHGWGFLRFFVFTLNQRPSGQLLYYSCIIDGVAVVIGVAPSASAPPGASLMLSYHKLRHSYCSSILDCITSNTDGREVK